MDGKVVFQHHNVQHYMTIFDQRTGFFLRRENEGYNAPVWSYDGPELLDVSITNYCEHCCMFCYRKSNRRGQHMLFTDLCDIVKQAKNLGVLQMALGGGNPNQHPNFVEILRFIREHNIIPTYTTNGDGLSDDVLRATAEYCGAMAVSAYEPYDHLNEVIDRIARYSIKLNLHIIIKYDTIDTIIEWLTNPPPFLKHVNAIIFLNYKPLNKDINFFKISDIKLKKFFIAVEHCKSMRIGFDSCCISGITRWMHVDQILLESCEAARFSAFISEDMKMYPCSFMANTNRFGDLKITSMKDIWTENSYFNIMRNAQPNAKCVACPNFNVCNGGCTFMPEINFCATSLE